MSQPPTHDSYSVLTLSLDALLPDRAVISGIDPTSSSIESLELRAAALTRAEHAVRSQLIGLDRQIARIFQMLRPWFLLPNAQRRPTVISLWGMTGVGKSSFVETLVDALDARAQYCKLDTGKLARASVSVDSTSLPKRFDELSDGACILFLDEAHTIRTLSENGSEIDRSALVDFWTLIDTGILPRPMESLTQLLLYYKCTLRAYRETQDRGLPVGDEFTLLQVIEALRLRCTPEALHALIGEHRVEFMEWVIAACDDIARNARPFNFTQSLIFVAGNLDEAFTDSLASYHEDVDVQVLHARTGEITAQAIKEGLRQRFRAEQIARLGTHLVVFPTPSMESFQTLIRHRLHSITHWIEQTFGMAIRFADSAHALILSEGVIAIQGVRPVLCAINELIEGRIGGWVLEAARQRATCIEVSFEAATQSLLCTDAHTKNVLSNEAIELHDRAPKWSPSVRRVLAVHEAGHAVVYIGLEGWTPSKVSLTPYPHQLNSHGLAMPDGIWTKALCMAWLSVCLAGLAAEQLAFGDDQVSTACVPDLQDATQLAMQMVAAAGMGDHLGVSQGQAPLTLATFKPQDDRLAEDFMQRARAQAMAVLRTQQALFDAICEQLLNHTSPSRDELRALISQHYVGTSEDIQGILNRQQPRELALPLRTAQMTAH